MCAIVDANVAYEVFGSDRPPAGKRFFDGCRAHADSWWWAANFGRSWPGTDDSSNGSGAPCEMDALAQ